MKNPLQQYTDKLHTQTTAKATNSIPPKRPWHSIRLEEYRHLIQAFFLLAFLYVLGISAILRADFNYIDDLGRVAQGYKDWDGFSRYLSNFLSTFLHTDQYLTPGKSLPLSPWGCPLISWNVFPTNTTVPIWRCPSWPPYSRCSFINAGRLYMEAYPS